MMWIDYPAAALGLAGAVFASSPRARSRRWGFSLWIISNVLWIAWALATRAWPLLAMQAAFLATSIRGVLANRESV